jgi:HEAT repeat protein
MLLSTHAMIVVAVLAGQLPGEPITEAMTQEKIRLLQHDDKAERLKAVKWFNAHSRAKNAALALSALERSAKGDKVMEVRREAVLALGLIAYNLKKPSPMVLFEALLDKEEEVRWQAQHCISLFKEHPPAAVDILTRCANSEDASFRSMAVLELARVAGKVKKVLDVIEKAKSDKLFQVRNNAHVAAFNATDRLEPFVVYLIRVREDAEGVLSPAAGDSELRKQEMTLRNLMMISGAMQTIGWSEKRPDELAEILMKLLKDPSPTMRRGAAHVIGAAVVKTEIPGPKHGLFEHILPHIEQDNLFQSPDSPKSAKKPAPPKPPEKSKVALRLEKLGVEARLRELHDRDPDRSVRDAARFALERLTSVQKKKS